MFAQLWDTILLGFEPKDAPKSDPWVPRVNWGNKVLSFFISCYFNPFQADTSFQFFLQIITICFVFASFLHAIWALFPSFFPSLFQAPFYNKTWTKIEPNWYDFHCFLIHFGVAHRVSETLEIDNSSEWFVCFRVLEKLNILFFSQFFWRQVWHGFNTSFW